MGSITPDDPDQLASSIDGRRRRGDRGGMFPSPLVLFTIIAITMASVAFVVTRGHLPSVGELKSVAKPSAASSPTTSEPARPEVKRAKIRVAVFNNSKVDGLAAKTGQHAKRLGWRVVAVDNWAGSVSSSTVYYPPRLKAAATLLAQDLGVRRVRPARAPMKFDRITVILAS